MDKISEHTDYRWRLTDDKQTMKKCSTSDVGRREQAETVVWYHYTPPNNPKHWQNTGEHSLLVGMYGIIAILESSLKISHKVKHSITKWYGSHAFTCLPKYLKTSLHKCFIGFINDNQTLKVIKIWECIAICGILTLWKVI
jgi:hypothetical protein